MPYIKPSIKKRVSKKRFPFLGKFVVISANNKKIIYVAVPVILLAVAGFISMNMKDAPAPAQIASPVAEERMMEKKPETYSRATFFLTQPIKGSLAMPESWEGRYRMSDGGNTVNFSYIGNPQMMAGLFSVSILKKDDWESQNPQSGMKISEQDGYVFIYKKADSNPYQGAESDKYLKMLEGADEIIKSFDSFKL